MGRGPKPTKGNAKPAVSRKSRKNEDSKVRDLEQRLAEALGQLQTRDRELGEALKREAEALEQQTATSELLKVIGRSTFDLQPVFDTLAENAVRLCEGRHAMIFRFDGQALRVVASHNISPELKAFQEQNPIVPGRGSCAGRAALERRTVHIHDVRSDPEYTFGSREISPLRTMISVPMLRAGELLGAINIVRYEVAPFTHSQIALMETFADQAAIAIENTNLFTELEARNRDLMEALEQQTATAEILRVISSSPTDVQPVLAAVVKSAARFCGAHDAELYKLDGGGLKVAAHHGPISAPMGRSIPVVRGTVAGRAVLELRAIHVADLQAEVEEFPVGNALAREFGFRTALAVPLLREGTAVGTINLRRTDVSPFTDKQVALLQTFADQAVIAIENVRLFTELEEKNRALTQAHAQVSETLERQTATSEILRVIASSPTDLQPVLDAVAERAARLCGANDALIFSVDGDVRRVVAHFGSIPIAVAPEHRLSRGFASGRAILERRTIHFHDVLEEMARTDYEPPDFQRDITFRTVLATPLLREETVVGAITIRRTEVRPFTDSQIALLQTFADQAVIAIENVRLFTELQGKNRALTAAHAQVTEALEQQTATSEILRVISQSQTDVQPVFDTIVRNALRLCGASHGSVYLFDGELVHAVAHDGYTPEQLRQWRATWPKPATAASVACTAISTRSPFRVGDFETDPRRLLLSPETRENLRARGSRSVMAVPMLRHGDVIGAISLAHQDVNAFSDTQVELLKTFADQAVIAIENVRLFKELGAANRELAAASQHKSEFLANMSHELRTPLNAIIGFSEVLAEKMFGELNEKQEEYSKDIHASGQHLLSLINDILDLSKIEAGRMELELSDFHLPTALDSALTLVRERAGRRGVALHVSVDDRLGQIQADERKVRQVVLNLLSNAIKFTPEGGRIEVMAAPKDGVVEVSVSDTGVGIAPEDHEKVFEEFRQVGTADKKAEGTGLGLTLCRKFVELHGGRIWVKSEVGVGSTFTFTIPVRGAKD